MAVLDEAEGCALLFRLIGLQFGCTQWLVWSNIGGVCASGRNWRFKMGGKAMPKRVWCHPLADPCCLGGLVEQAVELTGAEMSVLPAWEQVAFRLWYARIILPGTLAPPWPKLSEHFRWQHDVPVLASLGLNDTDNVLGTIDVAGP